MDITQRQTTKGSLHVTLASIDIVGARVDATLDGLSIAAGARVVEIPAILRNKAPKEYSHLFYRTDSTQQPVALKACEMAPVLAQITAYAQENSRKAALPVHRERIKAERLFAKAADLQNDPGRYFPALLDAQEALATWREAFPGAAREEDLLTLLEQAEDLDHKAAGALVYDADGWLSGEEQEQRAAEFKAQAQAKREEAARL